MRNYASHLTIGFWAVATVFALALPGCDSSTEEEVDGGDSSDPTETVAARPLGSSEL
ncbi:hypothetical protein GGQ19_001791 [Salinibacter ruber]|nr:hypothetical protein [Salinibacter ruber]